MKKLVFGIALLFIAPAAHAQISKHAIGLRSAYGWGYGSDITYQYALSQQNRIQLDLGLKEADFVSATNLTATYQWVKDMPSLGDNFRLFYGFGATTGIMSYEAILNDTYPNLALGFVGIGGIEYDFKKTAELPLMVALDFMPTVNFLKSYYNNVSLNPSFSIRWQFD